MDFYYTTRAAAEARMAELDADQRHIEAMGRAVYIRRYSIKEYGVYWEPLPVYRIEVELN